MKSSLRLIFGSLFIISVAILATAAVRTRVIIPGQAYSSSDVLTLSAIARIDGEDVRMVEKLRRVSLGYAPTFGNTRSITREEILSAVESAGIEPAKFDLSMPAKVDIERASQTVNSEQITKSIEDYVRNRFAWSVSEVTLKLASPLDDVLVQQGQLVIRPSIPGTANASDRLFVNVSLEVDGKVVRYLSLELNVEATAIVAVAARNIDRGQPVTLDDVRFERRQVGADLRRYLTNGRDLVGKAAGVSIQEGAILQSTMLNDRMLIKRGDEVKVIAKAGALEILTTGEAKGGGRLGDRVEIITRSSGQIIVGEIIGDKTVRVTF
jgi:flagella basal body P-ring formation protein FlgA